ncbi:MAG: hypothetical protein AAFZ15_08575 [Bacteroidota bacterium]
MEKRLEQLLLSKKFGQLTAEEKYYVTESIGETEYNRMSAFLFNSKKTLKNAPPVDPVLKNKLMRSFRKKHGIEEVAKTNLVVRIINYKMPAWQVAAAIALLFGLNFWLQAEPAVITETETVYVHSTDTIYKEVALPAIVTERPVKNTPPRINVKPSIPDLTTDSLAEAYVALTPKRNEIEDVPAPDTFGILVSQPRGQSASQASELWDLLSEVY